MDSWSWCMTWGEFRKSRALSNNSERFDTGVVGTNDACLGGVICCVSFVAGGTDWLAGGEELSESTVITELRNGM